MSARPDVVQILGRDDATAESELRRHGLRLSLSEARKVCGLLGRDPSRAEAFLFDVAWSEHCSYKSTRSVLKTLFREPSDHVVVGPGEDAGVVRFATWQGESYCLVMGHESHNHPSQILPVEGAATGIGGIVRDVYCMGADVIGVLDALRFGDPSRSHCAEIARGVVEGIWRYGNALGVPNLGGDVYFDPGFNDNCLVNVIAIGLVRERRVVRSRVPGAAASEPYVAVLAGKPTDGSGFGGASFASKDLKTAEGERDLAAVQVADPFLKRVLAEANRAILDALFEEGAEFGFKDLGAGGIGGATIELAAAGHMGVTIDLDQVRIAQDGLPPEVILVGETQERFVWAVPERLAPRVVGIYEEVFDLPRLLPGAGAVVLGRFTDDGSVVVRHGGSEIARCRARELTEGIGYERSAVPPPAPARPAPGSRPRSPAAALLERFHAMLAHPEGASREFIYRHYDSEVRGATVFRPGEADAVVVAPIPGCPIGVAVAVDGSPHLGRDDPYQAGAWAVAGAVRNVAAAGGWPIALSDCLNFGNPENPEVFWTFREAVRGIAETAAAIGLPDAPARPIPIITGNVSLYNQSVGGAAIPPSPIVGCIGRVPDVRFAIDLAAKEAGNRIVWAGGWGEGLGGTLYARVAGIRDRAPKVDAGRERGLVQALLGAIAGGTVCTSHDVSEGGLLTALFEMLASTEGDLGASIDLTALPGRPDPELALFGEAGAVLLEAAPTDAESLCARFHDAGVAAAVVGELTRTRRLDVLGAGGEPVGIELDAARALWRGGLTKWLL
jgi:phosphoribosylformylglycinamidine synthase